MGKVDFITCLLATVDCLSIAQSLNYLSAYGNDTPKIVFRLKPINRRLVCQTELKMTSNKYLWKNSKNSAQVITSYEL